MVGGGRRAWGGAWGGGGGGGGGQPPAVAPPAQAYIFIVYVCLPNREGVVPRNRVQPDHSTRTKVTWADGPPPKTVQRGFLRGETPIGYTKSVALMTSWTGGSSARGRHGSGIRSWWKQNIQSATTHELVLLQVTLAARAFAVVGSVFAAKYRQTGARTAVPFA